MFAGASSNKMTTWNQGRQGRQGLKRESDVPEATGSTATVKWAICSLPPVTTSAGEGGGMDVQKGGGKGPGLRGRDTHTVPRKFQCGSLGSRPHEGQDQGHPRTGLPLPCWHDCSRLGPLQPHPYHVGLHPSHPARIPSIPQPVAARRGSCRGHCSLGLGGLGGAGLLEGPKAPKAPLGRALPVTREVPTVPVRCPRLPSPCGCMSLYLPGPD
jgi:hypothetical protein